MKNFILSIALLSATNVKAQVVSTGKILFKETIKLKIDFGEENAEMAKMIPPSQTSNKVLYFNEDESIYKNEEKVKDLEINQEMEDKNVQMVFKIPESTTYLNKKEGQILQTQDLMGKPFLIKDKPTEYNWKVTNEQKKILNYVCQKAILNDTSKSMIVYFTPQIPVSIGPNGMTGLPGMILAVEQDNGQRMMVATEVSALPDNYVFDKPTKGKETTRAEFNKIREEKMKEMGATNTGSTGVKMIIRH